MSSTGSKSPSLDGAAAPLEKRRMSGDRLFLPEPEPPPAQPQPQRSSKRTLLLWMVLIALFLAIWSFLAPDTPAKQPSVPSRFGGWWIGLIPAVPVVGFAVYFVRTYKQALGFDLALERGRRAMAERRFQDAARAYAEVAAAHAKHPVYASSATSQCAAARLAAGEIEQARALFTEVEKNRSVLFASAIRLHAAIQLGMTNALLGELDAAEAWVNEVRTRFRKTKDERLANASLLCLVEVIIELRRGRRADALQLLESNWLTLRETLTANHMRVVEVIRSFAEANPGQREYAAPAGRLVRIEPVQEGEFAYLGVGWPEMKTFLLAHGLG